MASVLTIGAERGPEGPQAAPPGVALGNKRVSAKGPGQRVENRRRRYGASAWLHRASSLERVRECGNLVRVCCQLMLRADVAHYGGLRSCGSPWACPVCSVKIAAGRVDEIAQALTAARADGWTVLFLTGTFSHHRGQGLADLLERQQAAWRRLTSWKLWRGLEVEYVRIREQTWGAESGWHPHYHAALLVRGPVDVEALRAGLGADWRRALVKVGLSGSVAHALDLVEWDEGQAAGDLAGYLVKQLALEVAGGPMKLGRSGRFSPFGVLEAAVDGESWAVRLWREYEQATQGRRTIFWSQGMRKYRPARELSDEELAEAVVGGELIASFPPAIKARIWASSPRGVALLELCEHSVAAALAYIEAHARGETWYVGGDDRSPPSRREEPK